MIEKDDWRLVAGPVIGNEEALKNYPSSHFRKNGITSIALSAGPSSTCTKNACRRDIAPDRKTPVTLTGFARNAMKTSKRCLVGH